MAIGALNERIKGVWLKRQTPPRSFPSLILVPIPWSRDLGRTVKVPINYQSTEVTLVFRKGLPTLVCGEVPAPSEGVGHLEMLYTSEGKL